MENWQIWGILGVLLLIVEMFTPALFFLNLSLSAIITGIASFYLKNSFSDQMITFAILSVLLILFLRPMLLKIKDEPEKTGIEASYIGQEAKVTTTISANGGRIAIYGEAWDAKTLTGEEILENSSVKIVARDGLTMIVEKI